MIALSAVLRIGLLVVFFVELGIAEDEYIVGFCNGVTSCPDFDNKRLKGDNMKLGKVNGEEAMFLEGFLEVGESIGEGNKLNIEISKDTDVGDEVMWTCSMDVCESIKDEDAPWSALFEAMNIKQCPIDAGKYVIKNMTLNMDFCKDMLNAEYVGDYKTVVKMMNDKMDTISCHSLGVAVTEVNGK